MQRRSVARAMTIFLVKGNQGRLQKPFEEKFQLKELNNPKYDSYSTTENGHVREETRLNIISDVPDELIDFMFECKNLKKCVWRYLFVHKKIVERTGNIGEILYKLSGFNSREACQCDEKSLGCGKQIALALGCGNE